MKKSELTTMSYAFIKLSTQIDPKILEDNLFLEGNHILERNLF